MLRIKKFFYLSFLCFILFLLATIYKNSDGILKQLEQDVVVSASKIGVFKGDQAENFQLLNAKGKMISLSDFKGKKMIVNFFATWCGPCQEEMPALVDLDKRLNKEKIVVVGVNLTKEEANSSEVQQFLKHFQVEYEVLFDGEGKVMKQYDLMGIPTTIFIDENGKIIERLNGMLTMDIVNNHPFFKGTMK